MSKSAGKTTQTFAPDAQTQAYSHDLWNAAQGAANQSVGVNGLTTDAARGFTGIANAGNLGFSALSGDPNAVNQMMSPYMQNVIGEMNKQYGLDRTATMNSVNDAATQANAFGGSRHGVAEGVALGQLGNAHGAQVANALNSGFSDAMNRAGSLANLGFGANGALGTLGEYMRNVDVENNPAMRKFLYEQQAMQSMPHGSTSTTTKQDGFNPITGILGGAVTGQGLGAKLGHGGWGTLLGGLLGGLG